MVGTTYQEVVERLKSLIRDKKINGVVTLNDIKEKIKKHKKGRGFRKYVGKEILIKDIQFKDDYAIVTVEIDGKEEKVTTKDKMLIKRNLIDFKVALDLGAKGIKVKVIPYGKSSVKFE